MCLHVLKAVLRKRWQNKKQVNQHSLLTLCAASFSLSCLGSLRYRHSFGSSRNPPRFVQQEPRDKPLRMSSQEAIVLAG